MTASRLLKNLFIGLFVLLVVITIIVLVKTKLYPFTKYTDAHSGYLITDTSTAELQRFAGGIRIPTVSNSNYSQTNFKPFDDFKAYLRQTFPVAYQSMDTATINNYGLVFHWKGKNSSLKPVLFLSHYDVVPVNGYDPYADANNAVIFNPNDKPVDHINTVQKDWEYPPFSGAVAHGRIYGRGTLDMKCMLFGLMEASTQLIAKGFQPGRDIYFAFGHDEEVSGMNGAGKIVEYFKSKNIEFDAVYDEGGIIAAPGIAGIQKPIALIGTAEKGFLTLKIKVKGTGGHSSMPPRNSSLVLAAEIIQQLEKEQFKPDIIPPVQNFLKNVGGEMSFISQMGIANQWLLKPLLIKTLTKAPNTNALVRTTTAVTMAKGSDAENVLPTISEITVNFRLLPGTTVADVVGHVQKICKPYDTEINTLSAREASGISPVPTEGYNNMKKNIERIYPTAIITPYLTITGTDAYKYEAVSKNVYRFLPLEINEYEQKIIHGYNEYISIENYRKVIDYFKGMMEAE
ncbi:M20/M25/M40 family metallo-hydrolase [Pinibacter aurantiacus]|uniref:M20/M25/M40 family metallo-hydrolase n=1 Tax=Pinibacter aurantiacus TaxID=2851599 RepID=A0A9E2SE00_9BACT|nr:M20/M25/M40 family metallo-hydrolase [Pinibacter aurantiacus]MBV4359294.1 M20/M25/M40 family metallo-hydrolase [Pinibacter aurantiacus]